MGDGLPCLIRDLLYHVTGFQKHHVLTTHLASLAFAFPERNLHYEDGEGIEGMAEAAHDLAVL